YGASSGSWIMSGASARKASRPPNQPIPARRGRMTHSPAVRSYGTVSLARQRDMSGLEFVQGLASGALPLNTIAKTLHYDIVEAEKGRVVVAAEPGEEHLNPAGAVHGGLAATLLDSSMGLAVHSMLERGWSETTVEFKITLVRPITPATGLIKAEGKV